MSHFIILAHRGNVRGPDRETENTVEAYRVAVEAGFGLEIDVRRDRAGGFYISHDIANRTEANCLEAFEPVFRAHADCVVAVNVKELGYELDLAQLVQRGVFGNRAFLFDAELLEPRNRGRTQRLVRRTLATQAVLLANRVSDRDETVEQCLEIPGEVVWADEFDRFWLDQPTIQRLRASGRRIYVISPELHGFDRDLRLQRWADFKRWQVDGICTDFANDAHAYFNH